jgi:hypothetical protein
MAVMADFRCCVFEVRSLSLEDFVKRGEGIQIAYFFYGRYAGLPR